MQDKIECDWFKPSKHEVTICDIQLPTSNFATKIKFKPKKKSQQKYLCFCQLKTKCEKFTMECIQNEKKS